MTKRSIIDLEARFQTAIDALREARDNDADDHELDRLNDIVCAADDDLRNALVDDAIAEAASKASIPDGTYPGGVIMGDETPF